MGLKEAEANVLPGAKLLLGAALLDPVCMLSVLITPDPCILDIAFAARIHRVLMQMKAQTKI